MKSLSKLPTHARASDNEDDLGGTRVDPAIVDVVQMQEVALSELAERHARAVGALHDTLARLQRDASAVRATPSCEHDRGDFDAMWAALSQATLAVESAFGRRTFGELPPWLQDIWEPVLFQLARRILGQLASGKCPPGVKREFVFRAIRELEHFDADWCCATRPQ